MPSNTLYNPQTMVELDATKLSGFGQGVSGTCTANTTTTFDLMLSDDAIITGVQLITSGASNGDSVTLEVYSGAVLVATPIPGPWYVSSMTQIDVTLAMPMKIPAGLKLRVTYTATVIMVTPYMAVNYKLWKVLI